MSMTTAPRVLGDGRYCGTAFSTASPRRYAASRSSFLPTLIAVAALALTATAAPAQTTATTTTLTSSKTPSTWGESVTFSARVSGRAAAAPTGTVDFTAGGTSLGTAALRVDPSGGTLDAGKSHTCAVSGDGGAVCWGWNAGGQLGDDTTTDRSTVGAVYGLASGIRAVSAGEVHSCALTTAGGVKCWGYNTTGQIGDGSTNQTNRPVDVVGLTSGAIAVSAGGAHSCALAETGGVRCWGSNGAGQLGDGSTTNRSSPVDVDGLASGAVAVSSGNDHTCALMSDGSVRCWGYNANGRLGDGTATSRSTPVVVAGLTGVVALSAGLHHTCALSASGGVACWGYNGEGELGDDTTTDSPVPVAVSGLSSGIVAIAAGGYHTCALKDGGAATCWGYNGNGQLGDGTVTDHHVPQNVGGLASGGTVVTAGTYFTCVQTGGTGAKCWGRNYNGQLGDGSGESKLVPTAVTGFTGLTRAAATLARSTLAVGTHTVVAEYGGDSSDDPSTSASLSQVVTQATTTTALVTSPASPVFGQSLTLTATVSLTGSGSGTPVGSVEFFEGVTSLGTVALTSAAASRTVSNPAVGSHSFTAVYDGNSDSAGSTSSVASTTVAKGSTTTSLGSSAAHAMPGGSVTLTATVAAVAPSTGTPTGDVVFKDGAAAIGTVTLTGDTAALTSAALATGTHAFTATYQGSGDHALSTSATTTVAVDPRVGSEFQVNGTTAGAQQLPAVVDLKAGGFVVAWTGLDGSSAGVFAQRYTRAGSKIGGEFRVNATTAGSQSHPAVAGTADGGFAVAWLATATNGRSGGVWAQRWSAGGVKNGAALRLDTTAGAKQSPPAVAPRRSGGFAATWISDRPSGGAFDVRLRLTDGSGKAVGGEIAVAASPIATLVSPPSIATLTGGSHVVVWAAAPTAAAKPSIRGQRLTATGTRTGTEFAVTAATFAQGEPAVAATADGGFVVVWTSVGQDGSGKGVYAQRYTAAGGKAGATFRVATVTAGDQYEPAVATRPAGGFVVAWTSSGEDGSGHSVHARRFGATATPVDGGFRLNTVTAGDQSQPALCRNGGNDFVAVWTSLGQDGSGAGVYGQRISLSP